MQPRLTGQILIGSSRQFGNEETGVDQAVLSAMLRRAALYLPAIGSLNVLHTWTGFRAATPDKLPLIGPATGDATLWLATGHEGLGITTALATAEFLAAAFTGKKTDIAPKPYLPGLLYNNPVAYGTDFLPGQIAELAGEFANLAAVKESSTDVRRVTAIRALIGDRLAIFVGVDDSIVEGAATGAVG